MFSNFLLNKFTQIVSLFLIFNIAVNMESK